MKEITHDLNHESICYCSYNPFSKIRLAFRVLKMYNFGTHHHQHAVTVKERPYIAWKTVSTGKSISRYTMNKVNQR